MRKRRFEDPIEALRAEIHEGGRGLDLLEGFLVLSSVLLGRGRLVRDGASTKLAVQYLGTLVEGVYDPAKDRADDAYKKYNAYERKDIVDTLRMGVELAARYGRDLEGLESAVRTQIVMATTADGQPAPISIVAKSIVSLWYCSALIDLTPASREAAPAGFLRLTAPGETYAAALVWKAVGGNAMGVPGPYYGNWAYPAPTLIAPPDNHEQAPRAAFDVDE